MMLGTGISQGDSMLSYTSAAQPGLTERGFAQISAMPVPAEAKESFCEGLAHFQAGDPGAALAAFSRSVELAPQFVEGHVFVGLANALTHNIYRPSIISSWPRSLNPTALRLTIPWRN